MIIKKLGGFCFVFGADCTVIKMRYTLFLIKYKYVKADKAYDVNSLPIVI